MTICSCSTSASSRASALSVPAFTEPPSEVSNWPRNSSYAEAELTAAYDSFLDQFETSDGQTIKAGKEEHVALEDEDVEQEQIVKQKRG